MSSTKIWLHTRWTDLTHPLPDVCMVAGDPSPVPEEARVVEPPLLEIISEADCWLHLRASDRGILATGRRGVSADISFSVIGGGLLACLEDGDDTERFSVGQEVTVESSGQVADDGRWVVRATGTAQEPHPSVVGRTNFRRMDDLGARGGFTFLYVPADRIRGFCELPA